ncbi:MAG: SRPBCC family protein [Acidobacteriota bacterium]
MHHFHSEQLVGRPVDEVFAFFSDANNLEAITPRQLNFQILTPSPIQLAAGARIDYQLKLYGVPVKWATLIETWEPPHAFIDVQLRGPYRVWRHTHRFLAEGAVTRIVDDVDYELPLGPVGRLVEALWARREVAKIFNYRAEVISRRFS